MALPKVLDRISARIGARTYIALAAALILSLWYFGSKAPPLTDADKLRITCQDIHAEYDNVPIAQLTRKQMGLLRACESKGL